MVNCCERSFDDFFFFFFKDNPFCPLPWTLGNTHLQTILNVTIRYPKPVKFRRQMVSLHDGGQTALDWAYLEDAEQDAALDSRPTVMMLTGFTGSSDELEVRILVHDLMHHAKFRVAVMHFRGLGGAPLRTHVFGDAPPSDVEHCLLQVQKHLDTVGNLEPLFLLGFSAGANIASLYCCASGAPELFPKSSPVFPTLRKRGCLVDGLVCISNPYHIHSVLAVKLKRSLFSRLIYDPFFVPKRARVVRSHVDLFRKNVASFNEKQMDEARGAYEFDRAVVAAAAGFQSAEDLYEARSCGRHLQRGLHVPALFINARDDPFTEEEHFPMGAAQENHHVMLVVTERGGHLGFMDGQWWELGLNKQTWDERLCFKWLHWRTQQMHQQKLTPQRFTVENNEHFFEK